MALQAGELFATFTLDMGSLDRSVQKAEKALGGIGKSLGGLGLTAMLTRPIVDAAGEIFSFGQDFEAEMSRVGAVLNLEGLGMSAEAAAGEMTMLRAKALEMGETTSLSASRAAEAMEALAMAGWGSGDIAQAIEPLIRLSEVSGTGDLEETASIVADTLTALGEGAGQAGRLSDVLTAAATGSNTDLMKLGTTFKYVASMAGALGFSMEDLALASGLMANAGIKAQKAGTGLRALLNRMSSNKKAQSAMEGLGISLYDTEGKARSLRDVMVDLRSAFAGLSEEEKTQNAYLLGGTSGMNAVLAIAGASEEAFRNLAGAIDHSGGTAVKTASKMLDNLKGDLTLLDSALGTTKILLAGTFEEVGRSTVQKLTGVVQGFNALGSGGQTAAMKIAALAASAGPCITVLGVLETTAGALVPAILGMISPAGLLTAGLAALGAAALSADGDIGQLLSGLGEAAGRKLTEMEQGLQGLEAHLERELPGLMASLTQAVSAALPRLLSLVSSLAATLMRSLSGHMGGIASLPQTVIRSLAEGISKHAGEMTAAAVSLMTSLATGVLSSIPVLVSSAAQAAGAFVKALLEVDWAAAAGEMKKSLETDLPAAASALREGLSRALSGGAGSLASDFLSSWAAAETALLSALSGLAGKAGTALSGWVTQAGAEVEKGFGVLSAWLSGGGADSVIPALGGAGAAMGTAVTTALSASLTALSGILASALNAMASIPVTDVISALSKTAQSLASGFGTVLKAALMGAVNLTQTLASLFRSIDWAAAGTALGEAAVQIVQLLVSGLADADFGLLAAGIANGILAAAEGLSALAGQLIARLVSSLTDSGNLAQLVSAGGAIIRSLMEGALTGASRLAEAVVNSAANLLGPAVAKLFGTTFESETGTIDVFRNTRFRVDPALFGEAEKTGRELESLLSGLLLPGGIASEKDLQKVTAVYETLAESGEQAMIRMTHGLSRYAQTGYTDLFGSVLRAAEHGGDLERAGQEAALLYMAGFGETVQGAIGKSAVPDVREKLLGSMEGALKTGMDAEGFIDVGQAAEALSVDLASVIGFRLPEEYRLAFNGMESELQRITENGFRTVAHSASFEGLFGGMDIWREVEGTTLAGFGEMAGQLAGEMQALGVSAGALLGKTLSEETKAQMNLSLQTGDTQGAAVQLLASLGLESAGEAVKAGLESAKTEAAGAGQALAQAADPGKSMTEVFASAGSEAAGAAAGALTQAAPEVQGAVSAFSEAAVQAFEEHMTAEEGRQIAEAFAGGAAEGIRGGTAALSGAASALGHAAVSALTSALPAGTAAGIGSRFAQGLAEGLRSGAGAVAGAAAALSAGAAQTVRTAWAIHSPSRVAQDMGSLFVEGLVRGLSDGNGVRKAAGLLAGEASLTPQDTSGARGVRSLMASMVQADVPGAGGRTETVRESGREGSAAQLAGLLVSALSGLSIVMDGRKVGETVAPSVSEIMAQKARERRFGG